MIDVAATVLEVAGLPEPTSVHGVQQLPLHGVSMAYSFDDAAAAEQRETQYFELAANRGIYHKGWTAVTRHSTPWEFGAELPAFDDDVWELYEPRPTGPRPTTWPPPSPTSCMSCNGCSCWKPANTTFPAGRPPGGAVQPRPGRPAPADQGNRQLLFGGMGRLTENSVVNLKNKSHAVTAQIVVPDSGAQGVLIAQGGAFGGWSLYATDDGRPAYCYNLFGLQRFKVTGDRQIPAGEHQVRMEFTYDGGGLAKGGTVTLFIDGEKVGEGRVEATQPMLFSPDETTDVGSDSATPVSDDYGPKDSAFTGRVRWVEIDLGEDAEDLDHLISPEERLRIAMARQ